MCGFCCHGETTVSLDSDDLLNMQNCLGLSEEELIKKYLRVSGNRVQMKTINGHCVFYDDQKGCKVHTGRPWRCKQWPLHPSIIADDSNFLTIAESCPGIQNELEYIEFVKVLKDILDQKETEGGWKASP